MLDLPPPYTLFTLPAQADAFDEARRRAGEGAGTLVWALREDAVDLAVVLEPVEALAVCRQVLFAGMNAAADALAADCPPEKPLAFAWPDRIVFDLAEIGRVRLAWAACGEADVPEWLVLGVRLEAAVLREEGFDDFETAAYVESFARHLMLALDEWQARGPDSVFARFRQRCGNAGQIADLEGYMR
jgi:biotin-(acetyl-CoA carboxylase) ligase